MTRKGNILVVDDNKDVQVAASLLLKQYFARIQCCSDPLEIPALMAKEYFDVILLDMNFTQDATSGREGFTWLAKILEIDPQAIVILITAYGDVQTAVQAIHQGATDFILKPWENERLIATTSTALNLRRSRTEVNRLMLRQKQLSADMDSHFHEMIGSCPAIKKVFATIERVARTDVNVLIMGENGTGKELVARALHRVSPRSKDVFISVDMGAISENLFESELFGHEKGAFTDAKDCRSGRFEIASGGTLFMDEISNLSLPMQAKLLRVLEERQITRLGSNIPKDVDIRLVCATNAPIYEMISGNQFRQDLLYRINTVEISLPPLRERGKDIALLAEHFARIYGKKYQKREVIMTDGALEKLSIYHWPGNVRELAHAIERAVIMNDSKVLDVDDFLFQGPGAAEMFESYNLFHVEKTVIRKILKKHDGNISRSAEELGLTRAALYRRMNKYDL